VRNVDPTLHGFATDDGRVVLGALDVVHQFAGYAVFLGFMSAFWLLSLKWLGRSQSVPA